MNVPMNMAVNVTARRASLITWLLVIVPPLILLAPALRPGYTLLPASLPYAIDPLWQPLAPSQAAALANPILSDQFYQYHAWKSALWRGLAQGEVPWWTPAINGGQPLIANGQVGLFDPFHLVGMLVPLPYSYVVGALLRLWVAGGFTYLYARTIGLSYLAAWLALLTFAGSGLLVHWLGATPSHVLVWLPALLWVGERWLVTRRGRWALTAALLVAVLLVSSQPEIGFQVGIAWAVTLLARATWQTGSLGRAVRRFGWWWFGIALLGVALAAVEVLPFLAALRESAIWADRARAPDLGLAAWLQRALLSWRAWPTAITTLLPNFLGLERDESYWYPLGNSFENNAYAGVLPLLLALLAVYAAWRKELGARRAWIWLWAAIGLGALALALELPLFKAINDLPPFSLAAPGRWRGVYAFAVAMLAAFGLDHLLAQATWPRAWVVLLAGAAAANLLLVGAAYAAFSLMAGQLMAAGRAFMAANVGLPMLDRPLDELYALVAARQQAKLAMLLPTNPVMYLPLLLALIVGLFMWLQPRRHLSMVWAGPTLLALTWLDLLWTGFGVNVAAPAAWLEPVPPAVAWLQSQPAPMRVAGTHLILNPNMSMIVGLEDVRGYDALAINRYQELLAGVAGYVPSGYHNYLVHLDDPRLDLFNVAYGLSRTRPQDARWDAVFADPSGVTVYRSRSVLPRAYLVYAAEVVDGASQSLARTLDPAFDARTHVILEGTPADWTPPDMPPAPDTTQVEFRQRRATESELSVTTPVPALVVLLDTYAAGWQATIDATRTPIYAANHAFRAVVVPAGTHTVRFTYAPPLLALGTGISAAAWLVVIALLVWLRARSSKVARP